MNYLKFSLENFLKRETRLLLFGALTIFLLSTPLFAQLTVTATATPTSGVAPLDVTFEAVVSGGTSPYTYDWDFGDGSSHGTTNPVTHTYNLAGKYNVTLTVTDSSAPPLTKTVVVGTITVYLAVTITATPDCGTPPMNVCFQGGADYGYEPYSYKWNFGDNAPAYNTTEQNPCHGYMNSGIYTATLTVTDSNGNTGSQTAKIVLYVEPLYSVTATADTVIGLAPLRVNFLGSHTSSNYVIPDSFTYEWDFGDGSAPCIDIAPQHIFVNPGNYTVTLTVSATNICGDNVSYSNTIQIQALTDPTIFITKPQEGAQLSGGELILESQAYTSGNVVRVDYYIDDVYVGSATTPPFRLVLDSCGANGTFTVKAILYDSKGNSAEATASVTISNPTLDGTHYVLKRPFRIKFFGTGFKPGAKLYFNGLEVPKTKVVSPNIIIAKGGEALKALAPKGVPILVSVVNADGSCSSPITFER